MVRVVDGEGTVTRTEDLNDAILEAARELAAARGYRFEPSPRASTSDPTNPRDPWHDGVSRTLRHRGEDVARAADDGATYCCGVTFQAWFEAAARAGVLQDLDAAELRDMVAEWFCPVMGHPGAARALVQRGLGVEVAPADARPGDLLQFWRSVDLERPSGHSVVFLGWDGPRIRYWSSQPATNGVGEHVEEPGPGWRLYFARAHSP